MKAIVFVLALVSVSFAVFDNSVNILPTIDVADKYIYVFKENIPSDQKIAFLSVLKTFTDDVSIQVLREFKIGEFHAFLGKASGSVAAMTGNHPFIKYYTRDGIAQAQDLHALACQSVSTESWGLNRVSTRSLNLDGTFKYDKDGSNVHSYIIDTGVYTEHEDFQGRATWGETFTGDGNNKDCNGHGTHVAGTIGGNKYGIAKNSKLVAVKVLNCFGSGAWSGVIGGIEWVAAEHKKRGTPSTANMSLGGFKNQAIDDAVTAAVNAGVNMAVAAGNDRGDACRSSPAATPTAITVGSTQNDDKRSSFSAVGTCVDIFAPGTNIKSAWIGTPTSTNTISGTSMATPHVCGVATQILQNDRTLSPAQVKAKLVSTASSDLINLDCTSGVHSSCAQSPNKLLHSSC